MMAMFVALLVLFASACTSWMPGGNRMGTPSCAVGLCFDSELMGEDELIDKYGSGFSGSGKFPYHCYEVAPGRAFVRFRISPGVPREVLDIFVSDRLACPGAAPPKAPFGELATESGLALGDDRERVIEIYGEPARESEADDLEMVGPSRGAAERHPFGDTALFYFASEPETLHAIVYLRDQVVSAFLISRFP